MKLSSWNQLLFCNLFIAKKDAYCLSSLFSHYSFESPGLGFITSVTFIFFVGVFMSSWVGASVLGIGEWIIKRMPLVRHIYNASKQISAAISPGKFTVIMIFNLQSSLCTNFCFFLQIKTNRHSRRQSSYDILVLGNMHLDSLPHQSRSRFSILFTVIPISQWWLVYIYFSWFFFMLSMQLCCLVILVAGMKAWLKLEIQFYHKIWPTHLVKDGNEYL